MICQGSTKTQIDLGADVDHHSQSPPVHIRRQPGFFLLQPHIQEQARSGRAFCDEGDFVKLITGELDQFCGDDSSNRHLIDGRPLFKLERQISQLWLNENRHMDWGPSNLS